MFWDKKENAKGLPDLPPMKFTPSLQEKNMAVEHDNDDAEDNEKHGLPSFPDSPMQRGFSQSAIKDAITQESTEDALVGQPLQKANSAIKTVEVDEWSPQQPIPSPPVIRKKDVKKGGWYTYYWTLNSGKSLLKFKENLQKNIETLEQQLAQRRTGRFFVCKNCDIEFNEENALTHNYTCLECGQVLDVKDLSAEISQIKKDVTRLKSLLATVHEEVQVISGKETKARERKLHAEAKKKQAERAAQKKARAKTAASSVKKPTAAKKQPLKKRSKK